MKQKIRVWRFCLFFQPIDRPSGRIDKKPDMRQVADNMIGTVGLYENLVELPGYIPNMKCAAAAFVFDFMPCLTVRAFRYIKKWLDEAAEEAEQLGKKYIGVYSIAGGFARIQSPDEFIQSIERIKKRMFTKEIEKLMVEEDEKFLIDKTKFSGLKFMYLTIDEEPEPKSEPILEADI